MHSHQADKRSPVGRTPSSKPSPAIPERRPFGEIGSCPRAEASGKDKLGKSNYSFSAGPSAENGTRKNDIDDEKSKEAGKAEEDAENHSGNTAELGGSDTETAKEGALPQSKLLAAREG